MLAYKDVRRWTDLTSRDVNAYVKRLLGDTASAKDFRTWPCTVLAAVKLAKHRPDSARKHKRAISQALAEVADDLGNTAAVVSSSYVDPTIIDLYEDGQTIDAGIARAAPTDKPTRAKAERAVLDLLTS